MEKVHGSDKSLVVDKILSLISPAFFSRPANRSSRRLQFTNYYIGGFKSEGTHESVVRSGTR